MTLPACFEDEEARKVLEALCRQNNISPELIHELYQISLKYVGSGRPDGIVDDLASALSRYSTKP